MPTLTPTIRRVELAPRLLATRRTTAHGLRLRSYQGDDVGGANEDVIRVVLQSWGEGVDAAKAATRRYFADDCVWEQSGFPTTTGPEEAAELFNSMGAMGFVSVDVDFRNVVSAGDVVCTERIDWLVRPDGSRVGPLPIVGVTEFRDGKISSWREYFDRTHLTRATHASE